MLTGVATDIVRLGGWNVHCLANPPPGIPLPPSIHWHSLNSEVPIPEQVANHAAHHKAVMIVAPETDSVLYDCVRAVESTAAQLISPDSGFVKLASCKLATEQRLREGGVPAIPTAPWSTPVANQFSCPLVVKPTDGAGGHEVHLVAHAEELETVSTSHRPFLVQPWIKGLPASVVLIAGQELWVGPPIEQVFQAEGLGRFVEGRLITDQNLGGRAQKLATAAANALPATRGYFGIDMILGDRTDGSEDLVVEVNPRITSSYPLISKTLGLKLIQRIMSDANRNLLSL